MPFAITWVDFEGIMLSKISQTEKDKYHMILLTCGVKNKPKLIESKNRLVVGRDEVGRGNGSETQENGDVRILMAGSCGCTAETNTAL